MGNAPDLVVICCQYVLSAAEVVVSGESLEASRRISR